MIDFSSKHNVLIRNEDGSLQPMDQPYFESLQIAPGTWQILSDGDYSYLVEGEKEAVVIDSGYGAGNIREYCGTLTSKPVMRIINTHDHFDHTANNSYFDCAYMGRETVDLATLPFPSFQGIDFPRDYPKEVVDDGYLFNLGGRTLEVFKIPDHAVGSIALLDKKEGLFFTGDEIMDPGVRLNGTVERFASHMEKLASRSRDYSRLCAGAWIMEGSKVEAYLENAKHILEGNEGVPLEKQPPISLENETDDRGRIIFGRRPPRPCDLPKHINEYDPDKRVMDFAGCRITYHVDRIR
ncbi:MAG: MBL fold metallo-hydrolase [Spirochaetales bacterium]|nr:MBL fold metallo-hydrolase [Spirochaetales bacterium]